MHRKSRKKISFYFVFHYFVILPRGNTSMCTRRRSTLSYLSLSQSWGFSYIYYRLLRDLIHLICFLIVYNSVKILRQLYAEIFGHLKSYSKVNKQYIKKILQKLILTDIFLLLVTGQFVLFMAFYLA